MKRIMLQCGHYDLVNDDQKGITMGWLWPCDVCPWPLHRPAARAFKIVEIVDV